MQAVDGRGVARKSGGDVFDINIEGPEFDAPHATIRDNAEGTYVVTWTGKYAGLYSIKVCTVRLRPYLRCRADHTCRKMNKLPGFCSNSSMQMHSTPSCIRCALRLAGLAA